MIEPADDEINVLLPVMLAGFLAVPVIIGVVVYRVFDLGHAIRRKTPNEPMTVVQAFLLTVGGVILLMVGFAVLNIAIEMIKTALGQSAH